MADSSETPFPKISGPEAAYRELGWCLDESSQLVLLVFPVSTKYGNFDHQVLLAGEIYYWTFKLDNSVT